MAQGGSQQRGSGQDEQAPAAQAPTEGAQEAAAPYGGGSAGPKRVRTRHFSQAKRDGVKIVGLTSYDYLSAGIFDRAGIDFLLVGDSAGNTVFGYDTTLPVTVDELIPLTRAVARAAKRALVIADLPFGSYETNPREAVHTAIRFMKETGAHAVKLEGGERSAEQIRRIVEAGIPAVIVVPRSLHRRCRRGRPRPAFHAGRPRSARIEPGFGRSRSGCVRIRFGVLHGFSLLAPRCPKGAAGAIFLLLEKSYQQMPISPSIFVEDRGLHFFRRRSICASHTGDGE